MDYKNNKIKYSLILIINHLKSLDNFHKKKYNSVNFKIIIPIKIIGLCKIKVKETRD
jgi:hypothetical protein